MVKPSDSRAAAGTPGVLRGALPGRRSFARQRRRPPTPDSGAACTSVDTGAKAGRGGYQGSAARCGDNLGGGGRLRLGDVRRRRRQAEGIQNRAGGVEGWGWWMGCVTVARVRAKKPAWRALPHAAGATPTCRGWAGRAGQFSGRPSLSITVRGAGAVRFFTLDPKPAGG